MRAEPPFLNAFCVTLHKEGRMGASDAKQGLQGAEFRTLGPMGSIRLKKKNSRCTSRGCRVQNSGLWDPWQASDQKKKFLVYQQGLQGAEFRTLGPMESIKQQHTGTYVLRLFEIDAARHPTVGRCCQQFPIVVRNAKRRHPTSSCPCPPSASAAIQELPSNLPNLPNSAHPSRSSWWQRAAYQPPETVL